MPSYPITGKAIAFYSLLYRSDLLSLEALLLHLDLKPEDIMLQEFDWSPMKSYYSEEMGEVDNLKRVFISDCRLVDREKLVDLKLKARELEISLESDGRRIVNIDPGIVTQENILLATLKNFTHRVYLQQGVYADLTLVWKSQSFGSLPWTYPDYSQKPILDTFRLLRNFLMNSND